MKTRKKTRSALAVASHACYTAANQAGVLRNGRPVRVGGRFRDERKEGSRRACRERGGDNGE